MTALKQIGTVCEQTGVNPVTLRAWERRYDLIQPQRTKKGRRLYSNQDISKIKQIQKFIEDGIPVSQVPQLIELGAAQDQEQTLTKGNQWDRYQQKMLTAIQQFSDRDLENIYNEVQSIFPVDHVIQKLISPVLTRLGDKWAKNEEPGDIAEEHFFRVFVRNKIGAMLHHRMHNTTGAPLVAACFPGEHHELGLLMFGLSAAENNIRVIILGGDTPIEELTPVINRSNSRGVVISLGYKKLSSVNKKLLKELTQKISIPVFIGGDSASSQKKAIETCGAICLGNNLIEGIAHIKVQLKKHKYLL